MSNVRISQLPTGSALTGTELVPVVQNGQTIQTTVSQITSSPTLTQTFVTVNNTPSLTNSRYFAVGTGIGLTDTGAQGQLQIALNGTSGSLETVGNGFIAKTAANTVANRTFSTTSGLNITNGDGISGNPVISVTGLLSALVGTTGTGLMATAGGTTITPVTIVGTSDQIDVSNGNTSPVIGLASNPIIPGTASVTVPSGTTGQRSGSNGALRYNTSTATFEGYANGSWGSITTGTGVTSVATGTGLTGGPITSTGTISIADTAVTAGSYGSASSVGTFTVNGQGQLTDAASTTISIPSSAINTSIPNASLTNSSVTIGTTSIALGATSLTLDGLTSVTVTQDPTSALQLATKQYVDAVAEGLHVHAACAAATTGTLASITGGTVTYNNGTAGVGATLTLSVALTVLDGYTLLNGDRVLVKNEAAQANNGIYTWATGGTVLTRATDFDTAAEMASGDFTFVVNGTLYANTGWVQTDPVTVVGTSPVTWVQFSGAGAYTAGTGLTLTGTQFSITNTAVTAAAYGSASQVGTFTVNAQGQLTLAGNTSIAISNTQVSGLGTMSTQNANSVAITGGSVNGTTVGATTAAAGHFSALYATLGSNLDTNGYNIIGGNFGGNQLVLPAGFGPTLQGLYEGNAFIKTGTTGAVSRTWTYLDSDGSFTSPGPVVAIGGISGGTF